MKSTSLTVQSLLLGSLFFAATNPATAAFAQSVKAIQSRASETGRFSKLAQSLTFSRSGHNIEILNDGRILIAGGAWGDLGGENSAEIMLLQGLRARTADQRMSTPRSHATQARLRDGRILFVGGATDFEPALQTSDVFDPKTNSFSSGPDMLKERFGHASVALSDGRVLVFGGNDGNTIHDSLEIYDPQSGNFSIANARMNIPRTNHTATLVNEKTVVLIGGESNPSDSETHSTSGFLNSIELFDIPSMSFIPLSNKMHTPRIYHTATRLDDHRVLISGGLHDMARSSNSIEILNLNDGSIVEVGYLLHARSMHTLTALRDGTFLVAGGVEDGKPLGDSERCRMISAADINCLSDANMSRARWGHTATLLMDGRVLFVGGLTNTPESRDRTAGPIRGLEVFTP